MADLPDTARRAVRHDCSPGKETAIRLQRRLTTVIMRSPTQEHMRGAPTSGTVFSPIRSHRHFRQELLVICIVKPKFVSGTSFDPIRLLRTAR